MGRTKSEKLEENLTEENNSVELVEESTDLAAKLANEDKEPGEFMADGAAEKLEEYDRITEESAHEVADKIAKEYESVNHDYSDDAKRFSEKFGDKSALDVILELDKKVEELWKRIF